MSTFLPITTRPLMILTILIEANQILGDTPAGNRRIVTLRGGTVEGERVKGRVLPGGGDWALTRADGVLLLDVRLTIETHDGALIFCRYEGVRHGPADVMARLAAGQTVSPSDMYFRIQPRFETAHPDYAWLNRILTVAAGDRLPEGPRYYVHEVL